MFVRLLPNLSMINKILLFGGGSIGGLFLLVKKYFAADLRRKAGLAMQLGMEGGPVAALLRKGSLIFINLLTFWSSSPASGRLSAQCRHTSSARFFSECIMTGCIHPRCIINIKLRLMFIISLARFFRKAFLFRSSFHDAGDGVIQTFLLAFSPRDVAVVSVLC